MKDLFRTSRTSLLLRRIGLLCLSALVGVTCLVGLWVLLVSSASAQQATTPPIVEQGSFSVRRPFGTGSDQTVALGVGDMDGDGDLDIVAGNRGEASSIAFNDGAGNFPLDQLRVFGAADDTTDLVVGDLDGDGDLDVVMSAGDGSSSRYLNDGLGNLGQGEIVVAGQGVGNESKIALGDINGDGAFDIVLTRRKGETLFFENDGLAHFPISHTLGITGAANLALGDLDGNRLLDVALARVQGPVTTFFQNNQEFTQTQTLTATDHLGQDITTSQGIRDITLGDFDGDHRLDVLTTLAGMYNDDPTGLNNNDNHHILYRHLENGSIGQSQIFGHGRWNVWSTAAGDFNGDDALDLVIGIGANGWISRIMLNPGNGVFTETQRTNFGPVNQQTHAAAIADLNGDGFLDIITGNKGRQNAIYLNDRALAFTRRVLDEHFPTESISRSQQMELTSVVVGDVDGDRKLDIITGNKREDNWGGEIRTRKVIFINKGDDRFQGELFGAGNESTWALALARINEDEQLDVISVNPLGNQVSVYLNDGGGHFPLELSYPISDTNRPDPLPIHRLPGSSVAAGDLDGRHGADLVVCSTTYGCMVYLNDGAGDDRFPAGSGSVLGGQAESTAVVVLADIDSDGNLDIVTGNQGVWNYLYLNDGTGRFPLELRKPFGTGSDFTWSLAVADVNGDNKPDIITGNFFEPGAIYLNDGSGAYPISLARPFGRGTDWMYSLAAGDVNGDGYTDFVTGNWGTGDIVAENVLFLNDGSGTFTASPLTGRNSTRGIALADMDGNGSLDIIEANRFGDQRLVVHYNKLQNPHRLVNNGSAVIFAPLDDSGLSDPRSSASITATNSLTFSYFLKDSEGEKMGRLSFDYSLDGGGYWLPATTPYTNTLEHLPTSRDGVEHQFLWDVAASGVMGRSDNVVLHARAYSQPSHPTEPGVYLYTNTIPSLNQWPYASTTTPPFTLRGMQVVVQSSAPSITNTPPVSNALVYQLLKGEESGALPLGGLQTPFRTLADGLLPGRAQMQVGDRLVALWPAAAVSETTPVRLYVSHDPFPLSGSSIDSRLIVSTTRRIGEISVWADISATRPITLHLVTPLKERVELTSTLLLGGKTPCNEVEPPAAAEQWFATGQPCQNWAHLIFTPTLLAPENPFAEGRWTLELRAAPSLTESAQLLGWGMALTLSPLHFTSATPVIGGLDADTVTTGGVQTLTVSSNNPLLLFDLDVAMEWNAANDEHYQAKLSADLRRASELLYDWTNGQVALGDVTVYHDARRNTLPDGSNAWNNAHIRIYANNRLRPNADQGGIISNEVTETVTISAETRMRSYLPGQVRMGAMWNRYGDATAGDIGNDWSAALAHELGHYLLFLDDNYLTLEDNFLIPLNDDDCQGAMNNPYSNVYSEFHPAQGWDNPQSPTSAKCDSTLSEQNSGRSDWETITHFYSWLQPPTGEFSKVLSGPNLLPIAVTRVSFQLPDPISDPMTWMRRFYGRPGESARDVYYRLCAPDIAETDRVNFAKADIEEGRELSFECSTEPITSTQPLATPIFYVKGADLDQAAKGQMRAFLFRGLPYPALVDLGQPVGDQVVALGARPDDRLCVYDLPNQRVGCKTVTPGDDQLVMEHFAGWQPQVVITPESSRTLQINVTLPGTISVNSELTMIARLYPVDEPALSQITMTLVTTAPQVLYSVRMTTETPVLEGYVLLGEKSGGGIDVHSRQVVAEFAIGGNPVRIRARHAPINQRDVRIRARHVRIRARHAPATSTDGQAVVYPDPLNPAFGGDREWSFTLQPATLLPAELPWATQVGRAYWLAASANITDVSASSIAFEYLQSDAPPGEESFIRMYFWEERAARCLQKRAPCWRLLDEQQTYPEHNLVSARLAATGLYAIFSHIDIPLQPGWNLIGYPVQGTRSISEALASIAGRYSMVYGSDLSSSGDQLSVYLPGADSWVSDLNELRFGQGYWIHITETAEITGGVTLHLKGNTGANQPQTTTYAASVMANPPAIFYGEVVSESLGFTPEPGSNVSAYIGEQLCGEGKLDEAGRYVVKVRASSAAERQCGAPGRFVTIVLNETPVAQKTWSDLTPIHLDLPNPTQVALSSLSVESAQETPGCRQIVRNGDFERNGDWVRVTTANRGRLLEMDDEHGRSLVLGILRGEPSARALAYSTGYQEDILLPGDASSVMLNFDVQTDDNEGSEGRHVEIWRKGWTGRAFASFPIERSDGWQRVSVDLKPYMGRTVNLFFEVANDADSAARWMAVDNVAIHVCE